VHRPPADAAGATGGSLDEAPLSGPLDWGALTAPAPRGGAGADTLELDVAAAAPFIPAPRSSPSAPLEDEPVDGASLEGASPAGAPPGAAAGELSLDLPPPSVDLPTFERSLDAGPSEILPPPALAEASPGAALPSEDPAWSAAAAAAALALPELEPTPSAFGEASTHAPARAALPGDAVGVRDAMLRLVAGEPLDPALPAFLVRVLAAVMFYEGLLDDERLERALEGLRGGAS
jgi:hypothetical protein